MPKLKMYLSKYKDFPVYLSKFQIGAFGLVFDKKSRGKISPLRPTPVIVTELIKKSIAPIIYDEISKLDHAIDHLILDCVCDYACEFITEKDCYLVGMNKISTKEISVRNILKEEL